MDSFITELQPAFHAPSEDARLVLFADGSLHSGMPELKRHLLGCSRYAAQYHVYLVSGLLIHEQRLCLCLFGPNGKPLCYQAAIQLALPLQTTLLPEDHIDVIHTELGNLCLCVDADIFHPQVARAAALKGADILISIQHLDPAEDSTERLMTTVWDTAQSNNLYVVNYALGSAAVCCPAPLTRAGDGYLLRPTAALPARFGLNLDRLDEIRSRFQLMENINTRLIEQYAGELGR